MEDDFTFDSTGDMFFASEFEVSDNNDIERNNNERGDNLNSNKLADEQKNNNDVLYESTLPSNVIKNNKIDSLEKSRSDSGKDVGKPCGSSSGSALPENKKTISTNKTKESRFNGLLNSLSSKKHTFHDDNDFHVNSRKSEIREGKGRKEDVNNTCNSSNSDTASRSVESYDKSDNVTKNDKNLRDNLTIDAEGNNGTSEKQNKGHKELKCDRKNNENTTRKSFSSSVFEYDFESDSPDESRVDENEKITKQAKSERSKLLARNLQGKELHSNAESKNSEVVSRKEGTFHKKVFQQPKPGSFPQQIQKQRQQRVMGQNEGNPASKKSPMYPNSISEHMKSKREVDQRISQNKDESSLKNERKENIRPKLKKSSSDSLCEEVINTGEEGGFSKDTLLITQSETYTNYDKEGTPGSASQRNHLSSLSKTSKELVLPFKLSDPTTKKALANLGITPKDLSYPSQTELNGICPNRELQEDIKKQLVGFVDGLVAEVEEEIHRLRNQNALSDTKPMETSKSLLTEKFEEEITKSKERTKRLFEHMILQILKQRENQRIMHEKLSDEERRKRSDTLRREYERQERDKEIKRRFIENEELKHQQEESKLIEIKRLRAIQEHKDKALQERLHKIEVDKKTRAINKRNLYDKNIDQIKRLQLMEERKARFRGRMILQKQNEREEKIKKEIEQRNNDILKRRALEKIAVARRKFESERKERMQAYHVEELNKQLEQRFKDIEDRNQQKRQYQLVISKQRRELEEKWRRIQSELHSLLNFDNDDGIRRLVEGIGVDYDDLLARAAGIEDNSFEYDFES